MTFYLGDMTRVGIAVGFVYLLVCEQVPARRTKKELAETEVAEGRTGVGVVASLLTTLLSLLSVFFSFSLRLFLD